MTYSQYRTAALEEVPLAARVVPDIEPVGTLPPADPLGAAPPDPPSLPLLSFSTQPPAKRLAADEIVFWLVKSIPKAVQPKTPSETLLPSNEYSMTGSEKAASLAKMVSTVFSVRSCVLME